MSRTVIRDIVIPIVERIMWSSRYPRRRYGTPTVRDPHLEEFLEEMMRRHFGVIGANDCQHLKEQLEEAVRNDPYAFEHLIKKLLERYVKLATKLRSAKKLKKTKKTNAKNHQNRTRKKEEKVQAQ